jgi:hypothetical protein
MSADGARERIRDLRRSLAWALMPTSKFGVERELKRAHYDARKVPRPVEGDAHLRDRLQRRTAKLAKKLGVEV